MNIHQVIAFNGLNEVVEAPMFGQLSDAQAFEAKLLEQGYITHLTTHVLLGSDDAESYLETSSEVSAEACSGLNTPVSAEACFEFSTPVPTEAIRAHDRMTLDDCPEFDFDPFLND